MLPRSGTCPKSRLDAHRVMYSHVELCSCWLQSLHGMFNLIPLAGAQQVTWPHYFTFRFFENTADVQFWAILEQSLHMCGHPLSSKCAIRCRDFWRKGMCFGSCWEVKQKMRSVSAGDHSGRMHQSSWVLEEVSWSKAASQWYRFFVSLRARKNDEFGSLDRAEFDPAYCHSIMSGYSPPAWLRCVTSISKMWDLEFPLEDNSGKWCRERLSTLIPTLRVVSTAKTIGTFSSTHARQQTRTRPKLIGNLFAKGQWTALGSLRRTWSLLQPGIRPGILHQMHQQPSWIFLDPYPEISRVLWSHCSCSILFHFQNLNRQAPDDVREEAAKIRLFCFAWTPFRPGDEARHGHARPTLPLGFRFAWHAMARPYIWFVSDFCIRFVSICEFVADVFLHSVPVFHWLFHWKFHSSVLLHATHLSRLCWPKSPSNTASAMDMRFSALWQQLGFCRPSDSHKQPLNPFPSCFLDSNLILIPYWYFQGDRYPQGEEREDVIVVKVPEQRVPRSDGLWLPLSSMGCSWLFWDALNRFIILVNHGVCVYIYISTYTYIYIYTYLYIYIYVYVYIYMYMISRLYVYYMYIVYIYIYVYYIYIICILYVYCVYIYIYVYYIYIYVFSICMYVCNVM